ncbi:hypothetical protein Tco_0633758 [Tanacetum coccineum]
MKTRMSSDTKLTKDEKCESVDSTKYRGMIGDYVDRKSNIDICTFVGCCLTSWFSKKQTALAISTTEAEYNGDLDDYYDLHDCVMYPLTAQQERKTQKDYGTKRSRHSTSSSFGQPSSSHLNDDDDDGNDEETSRASTPSLTHFVNSLTNEVPRVFENPPNIDPDMETFYTRQTEILNL